MKELIEIIAHFLSNPLSMTSLLIIVVISLIWTVHWMTKRFTKIDMTQQHFEQRLDMNVEAIKEVKAEIVRLSEKMDKRFDKVDERFDKVDERFDKIEARLNNMDKRFAKGDSNFARIEEKLSELNAGQLRLEGKVDKFGDKVDNMNDKLDATREDVAGLKAVVRLRERMYSIPVNVHKKSLRQSVQ